MQTQTETKNWMAIMGADGHTEITWSPANDVELKGAMEKFAEMRAKGYSAYKTDRDNKRTPDMMEGFDPTAEGILFVPQFQGG